MTIIISKKGQKGVKLYPNDNAESFIQEYVSKHPESLPLPAEQGYEPDLMIIKREFQSGGGPIDVFGVDQGGQLYIIETKLWKNEDKRNIVAQMGDYAAGLFHSYKDDNTKFREALDEATKKQIADGTLAGNFTNFDERWIDFFDGDDPDLVDCHKKMAECISTGEIKQISVMDELFSKLLKYVEFHNQTHPWHMYAIKLAYYQHDDTVVIVPTLYGAEEPKLQKTTTGGQYTINREFRTDEEWLDFNNISPETKQLYQELKKQTLALGDVEHQINVKTLGFIRNSKFMDVKPRKDKLLVFLNLKWGTIDDNLLKDWLPVQYDNKTRGLRNMGKNEFCLAADGKTPKKDGIPHYGMGDYEFTIMDQEDVPKLIPIAKIAYDKK
jgi:predicted transport protein